MPRKAKKAKQPQIEGLLGPLETEVMRIFWTRGASLVAEIEEVLNDRRSDPLAYKTVLTICTRLDEKGLLSHEKEGRAFRYAPTMNEGEFVVAQSTKAADALIERFGDIAISSFVDKVAADPKQLAALRELLDKQDRN
jgi:predicted transcriptional regulator